MMITSPEGIGHYAVINNGRTAARSKQRGNIAMPELNKFEDTIPTDFGGLNERRYYTKKGMRFGLLLLIASALVSTIALVVIVSTLSD